MRRFRVAERVPAPGEGGGEGRVVSLQPRPQQDQVVPAAWLPPAHAGQARPAAGTRPRKSLWARLLFCALVLLPTAATAVYLFAIATDQYISEARFVVRSAQRQNVGGLSAFLQSSGLSSMQDESAPVTEFIKSRDALAEIDGAVGFRDIVGRSDADFLARFPSFYTNETFEDLFEHYSGIVGVVHDATTGINTLKVRTFVPADSRRVAEALLGASEQLVNRMNRRALGDAVALASREVEAAEKRSANAQKVLTDYRNAVGLVDATSTTRGHLELIGGLERDLSQSRAQLGQLQATAPGNPGIPALRDRVAALEQQVATERGRLVGSDASAVATFGEFTRLTVEAEFASKAVTAANTMLETARFEALRKQLYLDRVVEPNAPDDSRYPRRILTTLAVFGTAFLLYGVVWLVVANAREHAS